MIAIATFYRGQGSCHDEEVRLFRGISKDIIITNYMAHKEKYFSGWYGCLEFEDALVFDQDDSAYLSGYSS